MKHIRIFVGLAAILLAGCTSNSNAPTGDPSIQSDTITTVALDTTGADLSSLGHLHKRINFKTYDQSLADYAKSNPNKPDSIKKVIYLLPLGDMSEDIAKLLNAETAYLEKFFQLTVKVLPRIPFNDIQKINSVKTRLNPAPSHGKLKGDNLNLTEQIEGNSLMEHFVIPNKPADGIVILGITDHDLYSQRYKFIYATSSLKGGAGLISTHRLQQNPYETQSNIRKAATKQIANAFSISNVKDYVCVMNFHNSVDELEMGVFYLSPIALEKLKVNIGFDYNKRFADLRDFWKTQGSKAMADFYSKCLAARTDLAKSQGEQALPTVK
jgi:archaemetzincin